MKRLLVNLMKQCWGINSLKYSRNFVNFSVLAQKPFLFTNVLPVIFAISIIKKCDREDDEEYDIDQLIEDADTFHENSQIKEAWEITETNEPELLWRIGRVLAEKAKKSKDKEKKKKLYFEALNFIKKALKNEEAPGCFGAHKWYAIIINYVGELEGTKSHIEKSYKALKIKPDDAISRMILGFWHFTFANLPSYQYYLAKAIFGTPPSSTYEEALKHFEQVESAKPGYYKACSYFLGEIHGRLGDKEKSIEFYKQAFYAPIRSRDDEIFHKMVIQKLKENGYNEDDL
uniref:Regulator of microtubule dynamics protein 1 n=1 Tax=Panagrolaimus sp. PS1159 TaxID=55785 RepID=A0AC35FHZ0_9BILA